MPDLLTRPLASASLAAMAGLIGFRLVAVNSTDREFFMLLVAIPCLASLVVTLPEPRLGPYVFAAIAAVAITAPIAGWHLAEFSNLDQDSGDLFRSGFEAALRLSIPATIPVGILLFLQERRREDEAARDARPQQARPSPRPQ